MALQDINGTKLDASWSVEQDGEFLAVILKSSSGRSGNRPAQNRDYNEALTLLIAGLRACGAVLEDALVDSAPAKKLSDDERRVLSAPIHLAGSPLTDEAIRHRLTSPQGRIGQPADAPKAGNATKRLRIRVTVPGYSPQMLFDDLSGAVVESPAESAMLASLDALTIRRSPDGTTKRHQPLTLLWAIGRAVQGMERQVPWSEARTAIGSLMHRFGHPGDSADYPHLPFLALHAWDHWELSDTPPPKGKRLAWLNEHPHVTGGLTAAAHAGFAGSRRTVGRMVDHLLLEHFDGADEAALLDAVGLEVTAPAIEAHRRIFTGNLGKEAKVVRRGEQDALRRLLLRRSGSRCALCGAELPERFLVAAHIKQRSRCSEPERRDLDNVAMLACTLGCDSLYEHGYLGIAPDGVIELSPELVGHPHLHEHARRLAGRKVAAWTDSSSAYFGWHLGNVFRAKVVDEPRQHR